MPLSLNALVFVAAAILHSSTIMLLAYYFKRGKSTRVKPLWKMASADGILFLGALLTLATLSPQGSTLDQLTAIFYLWLAIFVFSLEIPGYIFLSRYDSKSIDYLTELRANLIKVSYSYQSIQNFKTKTAERNDILSDSSLDALLHDFIESCEQKKNIDKPFWDLALAELTTAIRETSALSKHPIPKLVDILSLTGLSFLLAQFLKLLG